MTPLLSTTKRLSIIPSALQQLAEVAVNVDTDGNDLTVEVMVAKV